MKAPPDADRTWTSSPGDGAEAHTATAASRVGLKADFRKASLANAGPHESSASCTARWHSALPHDAGSGAPDRKLSPRCSHTPRTNPNAWATWIWSWIGSPLVPQGSSGPPAGESSRVIGSASAIATMASSSEIQPIASIIRCQGVLNSVVGAIKAIAPCSLGFKIVPVHGS